jgi:hypothetical protein
LKQPAGKYGELDKWNGEATLYKDMKLGEIKKVKAGTYNYVCYLKKILHQLY